ncbi:radical SAM/SPASM domain-containing protein [Brevibacillus laterosporus]|uniref:radical SAM/SPASM domain-containing protein n=1 Tax=Brevibacillus laterosporus TaxID=1465 RepID=UPI000839BF0E|nr:radical SAM protein [Brevibacillus laterosporus]
MLVTDDVLTFPRLAVYREKEDYIIHNYLVSSWIVLNQQEYEIAHEMIYNKKSPQGLIDEQYDASLVKRVIGLIRLYKIDSFKVDTENKQSMHKPVPKSVYFVTTYKCNLNCVYCYAESSPSRSMDNDISTEEAKRVITEVKELGTKTIVFTGGEAFLRKDLVELMEYSDSLGLHVHMISNGSFISNKEIANKIAEITKLVTISLDSMIEDEHDKNRGKGSWQKAKKAIDLLLEAGCKLKINQTITKNNMDAVEDVIDYTNKNNIRLIIAPVASLGRGKTHEHELNNVQRIKIENTIINKQPNFDAVNQFYIKNHCGHAYSEFSVDSKGDVFPCKIMHNPQFLGGNVKDKSLEEIYYESPVFTASRNRITDNLPICGKCTFKHMCGGGCRAIQWSDTDSIDGTNTEECKIIKSNLKKHMWNYFRKSKEEVPS